MGTVNEYIPERLEFALKSQHESYYEPYDDTYLKMFGVYLNPDCVVVGYNVRLLPGSVIGFKGFSWGFHEDLTPEEIRHQGGVIIGNNVEIGANCTVMRATLKHKNTIIGHNVKIDSQVHVGHNCVVGDRCIITACTMLAGSVIIGENSWLGPNCSIMNGIKIGKNNLIGLGAVIRKDTEDNAVMYGAHQFLRYR